MNAAPGRMRACTDARYRWDRVLCAWRLTAASRMRHLHAPSFLLLPREVEQAEHNKNIDAIVAALSPLDERITRLFASRANYTEWVKPR